MELFTPLGWLNRWTLFVLQAITIYYQKAI